MLRTYSLQTYTGLSLVKGGNETPAFVLQIQSLSLSLKVGIKLWQFLPEIINASLEERVRNEEVLFYIILFYAIACFTGEDDKLSDDIHTTEVDTWIRLTVTLLLCQFHGLREWNNS